MLRRLLDLVGAAPGVDAGWMLDRVPEKEPLEVDSSGRGSPLLNATPTLSDADDSLPRVKNTLTHIPTLAYRSEPLSKVVADN